MKPHLQRPVYICKSCLRQTKPHSRTYSTTKNPPIPPQKSYTLLPSRRLLSLSGPDATQFLQGAITANISPPNSNQQASNTKLNTGFYAAFLNAQGRLLNDVFIYRDKREGLNVGEGWLVEVDGREVESLGKLIRKYRLRRKFEVRVLDEGEGSVWGVWGEDGDGNGEGWTKHGLEGNGGVDGKKGEIGCEDSRAPGMGRRLVLSGGQKPELDMEESSEDVYRVRRYLKGVPEGQDELIREHALPQESCVDFMGGIDYRKGCYVGQELTIRTHHTGVVRKRVLPVMIYGKDEKEPSSLEYDPEKDYGVERIPRETSIGRFEKKGRSAGKFLAGVGNIGLGLCRLEMMTDVQVQGAAGGYKEGDEFKLEWEVEGNPEMVKVKAFVPSWHLKQ